MATDIGTRIKRARERKRWTQSQLADALKVNRKTVDNWENGRTQPASSIGALEEVLGVSLDEEVPDRSPPARLRDSTREAIRADPAVGDMAEWVISYIEGLASGTIRPAEDDPGPRAAAQRRPGRA